MPSILTVVTPVFAVILVGYLAARFRLLNDATGKGLSDFIFTIAMPAFLFRTMATVAPSGVPQAGLLGSYFIANAAVWVLAALATTFLLRRPASEAPSMGMAAGFGNTVMLGLPLGTAYFGDRVAAAMAVIVALHAPILWMAASLHQAAVDKDQGASMADRLREVAKGLVRNPIVVAVLAGGLWHTTGAGLPVVADKTLALVAGTAVPGALFALGMSLSRFEVRTDFAPLAVITALKLLVMPLIAYWLAISVFALPPPGVQASVLLAACPTGANAFLFASRYEKAVGPVSGAIALGTALAAITISITLLSLPV